MQLNDLKKKSCLELNNFFNKSGDGLFYLSHASILVKLNNKNFLFDPVLAKPPHLGSWLFYPEMKIDKCLLKVDGVFISHQHQDHFDIDFLKLLPKTVPIFIVAGRPQFNKILHDQNIPYIEIPENIPYDLGGNISCFGLLHEYNGIDSSITITNNKFTVYHGNDCFLSKEKIATVKNFFNEIDVACIPFAYIHWYPFLLDNIDEEWKSNEAIRLINKYLDYGLSQIESLSPSIVIPFGANMFYFDDIDSTHNKAVVSPFDFKEYAIKKNFLLKDAIQPLFAGDYLFKCDKNHLNISSSNLTRKELMNGLKEYINYARKNGTGFDNEKYLKINYESLKNLDFIEKRLYNSRLNYHHNIYISNITNTSLNYILINLQSGKAITTEKIDYEIPYHLFKLDDLAYKAYLSQSFSFNEIVASSRFRLTRIPNLYNLDVLKIVNNIL
jgi:L-ascorbate metabolism protein UlaG (beta-lactamase superfamily)